MGISDADLEDSDLGDFRPLVDKFYNFDNADNKSYLTGYIVLLSRILFVSSEPTLHRSAQRLFSITFQKAVWVRRYAAE